MLANLNPAWLTLAGAILGGSGLKVIDFWLGRSKVKDDSATSLRAELREDLRATKEELDKAESESDEWRVKYYLVVEAYQNLRVDFNQALFEINRAGLSTELSPHKTLKQILGET